MKISGKKMCDGWTLDCGGKQDLDFEILRVGTRYYPDHSAVCQFIFGHDDEYEVIHSHDDDYIWGESEAECKLKTEQWIKENTLIAIDKLKTRLS